MEAVKMVMGPRPGLVIVKFWQGVVEIVLRILLIVFCVATFIASAISLHHTLENLPPQDASAISTVIETRISSIADLNYVSLLFNARAASATGIAISLLTITYEILPIVLRFLNIGFINYKIKIFLGIDVVISFVLASVLALVGILSAYLAVQWADLENSGESSVRNAIGTDALPRARDVYAATAGTSLLAALFGSILTTWVIFFLIQKWNEKVIKETVKSAVSL